MRMTLLLLAILTGAQAESRILVHGHRGARAVLPENTLPAFEHAIEAGADFIELDLAVTKDDALVVSHDPVLRPDLCTGAGTRVIREMTLEELKRWDCGSLQAPGFPKQKTIPGTPVPSLDEVLALRDRRGFGFNIEMKIPADEDHAPPVERFARLVVDAVRKRALAHRVIVQSFDFAAARAVKELAPELAVAALWSEGETDFTEVARKARAEIAAPHYRLVTPERVRRAHDAGVQVVPWTANEPEVWERLAAAGVDGIITDDPAALIEWLATRGLRDTTPVRPR